MKVLIKKSFNIDDENDKFFFCENQNPPDILLSMAIGTVQSVNPSQLGLENPYISPHLQILKWDFSESSVKVSGFLKKYFGCARVW